MYPGKGFMTGWITYVRRSAFGAETIKVLKFRKQAEFLLTDMIWCYYVGTQIFFWLIIRFSLRLLGVLIALYVVLYLSCFILFEIKIYLVKQFL